MVSTLHQSAQEPRQKYLGSAYEVSGKGGVNDGYLHQRMDMSEGGSKSTQPSGAGSLDGTSWGDIETVKITSRQFEYPEGLS